MSLKSLSPLKNIPLVVPDYAQGNIQLGDLPKTMSWLVKACVTMSEENALQTERMNLLTNTILALEEKLSNASLNTPSDGDTNSPSTSLEHATMNRPAINSNVRRRKPSINKTENLSTIVEEVSLENKADDSRKYSEHFDKVLKQKDNQPIEKEKVSVPTVVARPVVQDKEMPASSPKKPPPHGARPKPDVTRPPSNVHKGPLPNKDEAKKPRPAPHPIVKQPSSSNVNQPQPAEKKPGPKPRPQARPADSPKAQPHPVQEKDHPPQGKVPGKLKQPTFLQQSNESQPKQTTPQNARSAKKIDTGFLNVLGHSLSKGPIKPSERRKAEELAVRDAGKPMCKVTFDCPAEHEGSLDLKAGDEVVILEKDDPEWWYGTKRGTEISGYFPCSFVQMMEAPPAQQIPQQTSAPKLNIKAKALFDFQAEQPNEVSLKEGCIVTILRKDDDDWWFGEVDGKQGDFPKEYIEDIPDSETPPTAAQDHGPKVLKVASAAFDFNGNPADHCISFKSGDKINILDMSDSEWFEGTVLGGDGSIGHFPANFVE